MLDTAICNGKVSEVKKIEKIRAKFPESVSPNCQRDTKEMAERLHNLRRSMEINAFNAYILLWTDQHQNDNLLPSDEAVRYLTSYDREVIMVIVTQKSASIYLQQESNSIRNDFSTLSCGYQVSWIPPSWTHTWENHSDIKYGDPLLQLTSAASGDVVMNKVGFYSKNVPIKVYRIWTKKLHEHEIVTSDHEILQPAAKDLVRIIWGRDTNNPRPKYTKFQLFIHHLQFAGVSRKMKILRIQRKMMAMNIDYYFTQELDEIAWMFNLRSQGYLHTALFKAYALISSGRQWLFVNHENSDPVVEELIADDIILLEQSIVQVLAVIKEDGIKGKILLSTDTSIHNYNSLTELMGEDLVIVEIYTFVRDMMIRKSKTELYGIKRANIRLSGIMVEVISMLKSMVRNSSDINEFDIYTMTEAKLRAAELASGLCEETQSSFGMNTVNPNYSPDKIGSQIITASGLFRLSAGAHFQDGTASFSRTFYFGKPKRKFKEIYTALLAGLIDIAMQKFPDTLTDNELEMILLSPLYRRALITYGSSGHGVGMFLQLKEKYIKVHRHHMDDIYTKLRPGHVIAINPTVLYGHDTGISLKIIFKVVRSHSKVYYPANFYEFEPLTFFPFQLSMINQTFLTLEQRKWLNKYHRLTYDEILDPRIHLSEQALQWLKKETSKTLKVCRASYFTNKDKLFLLIIVCVSIVLTNV